MEHLFTEKIKEVLQKHFDNRSGEIFERSLLIQYINEKTRSANKGSKARSSFANLFAVYVVVEDYIENGYDREGNYSIYEGSAFNKLMARQRTLPFGNKLQNHALNNRMNSEFQKFFPSAQFIPILRNLETNRYWINENLLKIKIGIKTFNVARPVMEIIDEYIKTKQDSFQRFIRTCEELQNISNSDPEKVKIFIEGLLAPNVDARLFEIVSYSILKYFYHDQTIIWGLDMESLNTENLKLYKTGRTNANDSGIDFVMKPLGRFFQVTETIDYKKYFLDIDKIQRYPLTFILKSLNNTDQIEKKIRENALKAYGVEAIVDKYMACIEEIINIQILKDRFSEAIRLGYLNDILNELVIQSKVEFNYHEDEEEEIDV